MSWACDHVTEMLMILIDLFFDLINRGQILDMTLQLNVPRFCMGTICGFKFYFSHVGATYLLHLVKTVINSSYETLRSVARNYHLI